MGLLDTKTFSKVVDIFYSLSKEDTVGGDLQIVKGDSHIIKSNPYIIKSTEGDATNGDLQIIKDATGSYKWLAVYSNSFRDEDNTPEIIGSGSQKAFVDNVDAGNYAYPELLLWHNLKWKFGKATIVAYDEVEPGIVFAIAGGTIDIGKEYVADALLESGISWKMSHGMPTGGIVREFTDGTVYAKHITTEITVLPARFAANPLTGFGLLGDDQMISNKKKAEIVGDLGISMDVLARLEESNILIAQAEKGTREFKEIKNVDEQTEVTEVQTETQPEVEVEAAGTDTEEIVEQILDAPANPEFDIQSILDDNKSSMNTLTTDIAEIKSALDIVVGAIETLSIAQKNTSERVDAAEKANEDEVIAQTPTFSAAFDKRIKSVIGKTATEFNQEKDGESLEGPAEVETAKKTQFGSDFLGGLIEASKVS